MSKISTAVQRLFECGGGVQENEIGRVFGESILSSLIPAIDAGLIVSDGERIWILPSLMLALSDSEVLL